MALESDKNDISYQYGRLLAVLEKAEKDTYEKGENRESNAIRMQQLFVQRPGYTTKVILEKVKSAYYRKLTSWQRQRYESLIGEIINKISLFDDTELNKPLKETYILGYYLQQNELYTKKEDNIIEIMEGE